MTDSVILPSYIFPVRAYFSIVKKNDKLIVDDTEIYRKQSPRNHFDILTSQGRFMITYPVKKPWRDIEMKDIEIETRLWREKRQFTGTQKR